MLNTQFSATSPMQTHAPSSHPIPSSRTLYSESKTDHSIILDRALISLSVFLERQLNLSWLACHARRMGVAAISKWMISISGKTSDFDAVASA